MKKFQKKKKKDCTDLMWWQPRETSKKSQKMRKIRRIERQQIRYERLRNRDGGGGIDLGEGKGRFQGWSGFGRERRRKAMGISIIRNPHFGICSVSFFLKKKTILFLFFFYFKKIILFLFFFNMVEKRN